MLAIILVILLILWVLGGFVFPVGGKAIHLLALIFVLIIIVRLARGQDV